MQYRYTCINRQNVDCKLDCVWLVCMLNSLKSMKTPLNFPYFAYYVDVDNKKCLG